MKYRLLQPLPFMAAGKVFGKGTWSGGGWGVDRGMPKGGTNPAHSGTGCRAHRGVETFLPAQNEILDHILVRPDWVEPIPESIYDLFVLLDGLIIDQKEFCKWVRFTGK